MNIIQSDRKSLEFFSGHGSAIAQSYNHIIMPLANTRDKHTQVIWGIRDFEYHFGRKPEGMWLSETAVDLETLDVLAAQNIPFPNLAPHQSRRARKIGSKQWQNIEHSKIDTTMPYLCQLPSGRNINLFFYNGQVAHDVSYGNLLQNGETFAQKMNLTVGNAKNISFTSNQIPNIGYEPAVISASVNVEKGTVTKAIEGNNGVYVLKVTSITSNDEIDAAALANEKKQLISRLQSRIYKPNGMNDAFDVLKSLAEIRDGRSKFY